MLHKTPIRLKVSNSQDWGFPVCWVYLLLIPAALLSPHPVVLTLVATLLAGVVWTTFTLKFTKTNNIELTSIIFPDGQVRLESNAEGKVAGIIDGQQWCTRWFAVLRFSNGNKTRRIIIRSSQQQGMDDFRRLNIWLRQDLFSGARAKQVLDS